MANLLDCNFKVSKFKFKSHCYVLFRTNEGKGMNPLIPAAICYIISLLVFFFARIALASNNP